MLGSRLIRGLQGSSGVQVCSTEVLAPADAEMRKKKSWRINKPSPFGVKTLFIWGVE